MLRSQSAYFRNGSSRRWFVDGPRWQTKCSAAPWSALSFWDKLGVFKFEKMLPCNRMKTQWNASFLKKRIFTSHLQNKCTTTIFSDPNQLLWKHFRSRARQRSNSQDQVSPYFRVFVLHTIYRLANAIKVISDVPVNRIARSCEASHKMSRVRKIRIRWKIFNRTRENWKVRPFSARCLLGLVNNVKVIYNQCNLRLKDSQKYFHFIVTALII